MAARLCGWNGNLRSGVAFVIRRRFGEVQWTSIGWVAFDKETSSTNTITSVLLPTGIASRSEVNVFSGVCLFVCLSVSSSVCQYDNFRTIKHRMMKLESRPSSNMGVKGQRSRSPWTKTTKFGIFLEQSSRARSSGSCVRCMFGKTSLT